MTNLKIKKTLVALLFGMTAVLNSCVQEDWYELYEDSFSSDYSMARKKQTKDAFVNYSCGVCAVAFVKNDCRRNIESTLSSVVQKCNSLGFSTEGELDNEQLVTLCTNLGLQYDDLTRNGIVNGVSIPGYFNDKVDSVLRYGPFPIIVNNGNSHWVVATSYQSSKKTLFGEITCDEVNCFDPQNGMGCSLDVSEIPCIIYKN